MIELSLTDGHRLTPFFQHTYDSCAESFLQGVMGRGFCDHLTNPTYGIIVLGEYCYLGGNPSTLQLPDDLQNVLDTVNLSHPHFVPLSALWKQYFQHHPTFQAKTRYALQKPTLHNFDKEILITYATKTAYDADYSANTLQRDFILKPIDEHYFSLVQQSDWSRDFTCNYTDFHTFNQNGLGFLIIDQKTKQPVAGASSYSSSLDSIELSLATSPDYRKRGFATSVSARMVLECLNRGKIPCWDAANPTSLAIAKKLGYQFFTEYIGYIF